LAEFVSTGAWLSSKLPFWSAVAVFAQASDAVHVLWILLKHWFGVTRVTQGLATIEAVAEHASTAVAVPPPRFGNSIELLPSRVQSKKDWLGGKTEGGLGSDTDIVWINCEVRQPSLNSHVLVKLYLAQPAGPIWVVEL